jgi:response regulator RpfG family c-di-GMP phosphodiesterase
MSAKPILLVDDEVKVLNALSRSLGEAEFADIKVAQNGQEALETIKSTPDLALIVSDYHMPGMNGIELLEQVGSNSPDITRILLTGAADLEMALDAVNRGHIFRFLLKPCETETLVAAVKDGLRQNELINAERELLSKTLSGGIKVMVDILAVLSPGIFAQASRLRNLARDLADALNLQDQAWEIELAALLSQIGAVTVPRNILKRWQKGELLEEPETRVIRSIPHMGKLLIKNIPRLENVAEAVGYQNCIYNGQTTIDAPTAEKIPLMARILKVIVDFDRLVEKTGDATVAFQSLLIHESEYDPDILAVFRLKVLHIDSKFSHRLSGALKGEKEMNIEAIKLGMMLTRDVIDNNGILIVSKDTIITDVLKYKLINYFRSHAIEGPVYIESAF